MLSLGCYIQGIPLFSKNLPLFYLYLAASRMKIPIKLESCARLKICSKIVGHEWSRIETEDSGSQILTNLALSDRLIYKYIMAMLFNTDVV